MNTYISKIEKHVRVYLRVNIHAKKRLKTPKAHRSKKDRQYNDQKKTDKMYTTNISPGRC